MKLRRFNNDGVIAFATYRGRLALEPNLPPPTQMLEDPSLTELIGEIDVRTRAFGTRLRSASRIGDRSKRAVFAATGLVSVFFTEAAFFGAALIDFGRVLISWGSLSAGRFRGGRSPDAGSRSCLRRFR